MIRDKVNGAAPGGSSAFISRSQDVYLQPNVPAKLKPMTTLLLPPMNRNLEHRDEFRGDIGGGMQDVQSHKIERLAENLPGYFTRASDLYITKGYPEDREGKKANR